MIKKNGRAFKKKCFIRKQSTGNIRVANPISDTTITIIVVVPTSGQLTYQTAAKQPKKKLGSKLLNTLEFIVKIHHIFEALSWLIVIGLSLIGGWHVVYWLLLQIAKLALYYLMSH